MNKALKTILIVVAAISVVSLVVYGVYRKLQKKIDTITLDDAEETELLDDCAATECEVVQTC